MRLAWLGAVFVAVAFAVMSPRAAAETELVQPGRTLVVALEDIDSPRFEYVDQAGELTGFHVEMLKQVTRRLGWSLSIRRLPWARALAMLRSGEIDALTYPCETPERVGFALFDPDNILHLIHFSFFVERRNEVRMAFTGAPEEMRARWRWGIVHDYFYPPELAAYVARSPTVDDGARNWGMLIQKLLAGHIDIAITASEALAQLRPQIPDIDARVVRLEGAPVIDAPVYIAFTRAHGGEAVGTSFAAAYKGWRATESFKDAVARFGVADTLPANW